MVAFGTIAANTDVTFGAPADLYYGEITVPVVVTANNPATPLEIIPGAAVTYDGAPVWVEFFSPQANSVEYGDMHIALWDATTNAGRLGVYGLGGGSQNKLPLPCYLKRRITPTAGSHTFRVCAAGAGSPRIEAGTGAANQFPPAFLRITKA